MSTQDTLRVTRRTLLAQATAIAGGVLLDRSLGVLPFARLEAATLQGPATDPLDVRRAQMAAAPIETTKLADNLTLLSGPGGNVVVLSGSEGKVVVDSFVQPAWGKLKQILDNLGPAPVKMLVDTHWHFDHTDNNLNFHNAGATILAHENTKKRLSETHELLGLRFLPSPKDALPTVLFKTSHVLKVNGEVVNLTYIPPAHTDTDIALHYTRANVLHMGDVFFNRTYPVIDPGTGGSISGMIAGASAGLKIADAKTKVVPGHGALGDKAALTKFRDVLVTVRDRVQKLKGAGRKLEEVVAARPTADLDAVWGKGFVQPNDFVTVVYSTL